MTIREYVEEMPFWKDLSARERETVLAHAQVHRYAAGAFIHSRDQTCLGIIRVLSGTVRTVMVSDEGREITLYLVRAGEIGVLSASCVLSQITFETMLIAHTDCELLILPAVCMAGIKENNIAVRCWMLERIASRFSDVMHVMEKLLFTRVDERIGDWLAGQAEETGSRTISATHEEIAVAINSSREVVSRALKEMERGGLVALGRGHVKLTGLKARA
ncbi:MAG: Crp/Fnr family transcriptional regulator [Lachnospiraceae bacterium]|nr:Crp/Fnr family transcriptional regulator [Lachnospiraceae bacterium]